MTALAQEYRRARDWQKSLWNGGYMLTTEPSGRTERTFASAPYGMHAVSAWTRAKRAVHFQQNMRIN